MRLDFKDDADTIYSKDYIISVNNMRGNPYKLLTPTEEYKFFAIDGANFDKVNSIQAFVKNFPQNKAESELEDADYDINLTDFQLYGCGALSDSELSGAGLVLTTPSGAIFATGAATDSTKTIKAELRVKGSTIDALA